MMHQTVGLYRGQYTDTFIPLSQTLTKS